MNFAQSQSTHSCLPSSSSVHHFFVSLPLKNEDLCLSVFYSCWSYVGRTGNSQVVSLSRSGCLYHSTVQHELLHALGFNHEQTRSDRDNHIQVLWQNISDG